MKTRHLELSLPVRVSIHLIVFLLTCLQVRSAPANDLVSKAQVLTGEKLQVTGTVVGATFESGEPAHNGYRARKSVWYSWTSPITGTGLVVLKESQSPVDMHIGIYTGTPLKALKQILTEDDIQGAKRTSMFLAVAGVRYWIAVDANEVNQGGPFTLNLDVRSTVLTLTSPANLNNWYAPSVINLEIKMESTAQVRTLELYDGKTLLKQFNAPPFVYRLTNDFAVVRSISAKAIDVDTVQYKSKTNVIEVRNPNEAFKDAIVISPNLSITKIRASGVNGSREPGEPLHNGGLRDSLWWQWTPSATGTCTVQVTERPVVYSLSVYTGSAVNDLKPVGGERIPSGLRFFGVAGTTYHIAFTTPHAFDTLPGAFELRSFLLSLQKDNQDEPAMGKTPIPLRVTHALGLDSFSRIEVYAQQLEFSTNLIGTVSKENPVLSWTPTSAGGYSLWAVAKGPGRESLSDKIQVWVGMPNDLFSNAVPITRHSPYVWAASANFIGASAEPGEPQQGGKPAVRSIWYTWTAPASGHVVGTVAKPYLTSPLRFSVYKGEDISLLNLISAVVSWPEGIVQSYLEFDAEAGATYRLVADLGEKPEFPGAMAYLQLDWTPLRSRELTLQLEPNDVGEFHLDIRSPDDGDYMLESLFPGGDWIDFEQLNVLNGKCSVNATATLPFGTSNVWFRVRKMASQATP